MIIVCTKLLGLARRNALYLGTRRLADNGINPRNATVEYSGTYGTEISNIMT